ncbi:hypothetical protein F3K34_23385 [Streptomyces sp. LBUM 1486]|nr:hypothetical protein [Streptomyces sp. LBUM 1485]MBP5915063.1 hypothetical protein [Streptomyces sp. LBUM 1486]QTU59236.1 hypothetical protein F3K21_24280 [Streptomyces sp. LBUM 1480]
MFSEPSVLRVTAAIAAATAAVGAAVMRRWDVEAGKRVADLTRARASDEWRHEERIAELETDLDESRELRTKLEHKLRAKRTELAGLRNEHAALLRRYATAETERASALEGRRLLEIEATAPEEARELPAAGAGEDAGGSDKDKARPAAEASPVPPQGVPAAGAPWASWETASKAAAKAAEAVEAVEAAKTAKAAKSGASEDASEDAPDDGAVAAPAGAGAGGPAADGDATDGADEAAGAEPADEEALIAAGTDEADSGAGEGPLEGTGEKSAGAPVFSPSGSGLFLRANSALDRIITQRGSAEDREEGAETTGEAGTTGDAETETETETRIESVSEGDERPEAEVGTADMTGPEAATEPESEAPTEPEAVAEPEPEPVSEATLEPESRAAQVPNEAAAPADAEAEGAPAAGENAAEPEQEAGPEPEQEPEPAGTTKAGADAPVPGGTVGEAPAEDRAPKGGAPKGPWPEGDPDGPTGGGTRQGRSAGPAQDTAAVLTAEEDDATGKSVAVRGHERAAADPVPAVTAPAPSTGAGELTRVEPSGRALPALPPAGHFTVPTAVAVVPATPQRRAAVEGGFDFFGTQKGADALEAVQNEDLADVVGQEALALHKAESEARFKPADEASRGVGQVIDLTAHDETEQIDLKGLRTAAS